MLHSKERNFFYRRNPFHYQPQPYYGIKPEQSPSPNKIGYQTMESRYSKAPCMKQQRQTESSRIANEIQMNPSDYESFQADILHKVETIQVETNQILEKKSRQINFLKTQLKNHQQRLRQAEMIMKAQHQTIEKYQKKTLNSSLSVNVTSLTEQNQKLKESLKILIEEKNQNWQYHQNKRQNSSNKNQLIKDLKLQVQELRSMVSQMEKIVQKCPSCFTLKRQLSEINEAYTALMKEYNELKQRGQAKEKDLLKNITSKIQENQNILRQNNHLREQKTGHSYYMRPKREKLKDSVAKRCRTLTDQF